MRALIAGLVAIGSSVWLAAAPARAQEAPPASDAIGYSTVDRATVRVFAIQGVGTARVDSQSGVDRLLAVPVAGHGSGLLVSADGLVLTARHVVDDAALIAVWVPGQSRAYEATVVWRSDDHDIAFLEVAGEFATHIPLDARPQALRVRETVHAIGYPLDARRTDPQSSRGIISGVLPNGDLQLDMALNPGNSGGPLIDEREQVVGIVVARGDPGAGVQGIGVAVPLAPIRAALAAHVLAGDARSIARGRLTSGARGAEVAELVALLARVGAAELIRDVIDVVDHHGPGEVLPRLRSLAAQSHDPEVLALTAAYFWDAAAVVLERAGGRMTASQVAAGPDRDLATELLLRSVALCRAAAQADPLIASRSPFVAHVLHYFAAVSTEAITGAAPETPAAPPVVASTPPIVAPSVPPPAAVPGAQGALAREETPPAPMAPPAPPSPDPRVRLSLAAGATHQTQAGFGLDGGRVRVGFAWSPYTLRAGVFAADALIGAAVGLGGWAGDVLFELTPEIGVMLRLGDFHGGYVDASWAPGLFVADGGTAGAVGSWRVHAGAVLHPITIGLGWQGVGIDGAHSLHVYEIVVGWAP